MSEKRFRFQRKYVGMVDGRKDYDNCVVDENNERVLTLISREDCKDVANVLNELVEEKEICKQAYREIKEDAIKKAEENNELKQRIVRLEDYKEASIKFTKEVEDFFERHGFDTVSFDLIDIIFDGFEFYSDKYDELKKENNELQKENQMLKHTIGRNESYIARLMHKGEWKTTTKY